MSHKKDQEQAKFLPEPSVSKDTLYGLGQSSIFDETFIEKQSKKPAKVSDKTKGIISIFIYLICSIFATIFIKSDSLCLTHFQASFFQSSSLIILIPISSLQKIFLDRIIKHHLTNEEEKDPAIQLEEDTFSELMTKKNYEHFYKYSKTYYKNTIYLIVCYLISLICHYWALRFLSGILCVILFTLNSVSILIMKCIIRYRKIKPEDICQIVLNIGICTAFYLCQHNLSKNERNKDYLKGIILSLIAVFSNTAFLYFWKSLQKKYKFYISATEVAGYMGFFSILISFGVIILGLLFSDNVSFSSFGFNYSNVFISLAKMSFCGVIVDFSLMKMVDYLSFGLISNVYNIALGIIFVIYWINDIKSFHIRQIIIFCISEMLVLVSLLVTLIKIISSNKKK